MPFARGSSSFLSVSIRRGREKPGVCTIYHSAGLIPDISGLPYARLGLAGDRAGKARTGRQVAVMLVDQSMLDHLHDLLSLPPNVVLVASDAASEAALGARADLSINGLAEPAAKARVLDAAALCSNERVIAMQWRHQLLCTRRDLHELNDISIALMYERDQDRLVRRIVQQGMMLTGSDGAVLCLLKKDADGEPRLVPVVFKSDSLPDLDAFRSSPPRTLGLDHTSIIGHAALEKRHLVIADAHELAEDAGFTGNIEFEREFGYYAKSMLVVPMSDQLGRVIGVLAYVNRKRDRNARISDKKSVERHILPYGRREIRLGLALASAAAASIENSALYEEIEKILESLVKAAVSAIDQRDPSTAGHSIRVATLTCDLAAAVERGGTGPHRNLHFTREQMRELHYAALLHDLGKVTVREEVLMKAKKLPPELLERIEARFDLIRRTVEADHYRKHNGNRGASGRLDLQSSVQLAELDRFWKVILAANEPGKPTDTPDGLAEIARHTFIDVDNRPAPYLTGEELHYLQIPSGTLDEREHREAQSHVEQTYQFLRQIPWTDNLKNLARYAGGHHEKLDGSGYPRGLKGDEIPVQTRLVTIADIFDALTEGDRPYRRAIPPEKALDMIQEEAKAGQLDADLVRVLVESQVYKAILP